MLHKVVLSLFLVFFANLSHAETQQNQKEISLILNWKAEPEFGGFYAAEIYGYFNKYKLNVKLIEGSSGTPTIQMLANDKVNYAIVSGDEVLLSLERNPKNPIIPLFAVYQEAPYMIMSHESRGFKSLADVFSNEGILAAQTGAPFMQFLLKKFPNKKVKVVPYPGGVSAFLNDKNYSQQGFVSAEPLIAQKQGAKVSTFLIKDIGFNPYTAVLAVKKSYWDQNKEEVRKLLIAIRKGWQKYLEEPYKTNKFMAKLNPAMDLDIFEKAAKEQIPYIQTKYTRQKGLGVMSEDRWKQLHQQLFELGIISNKKYTLELYREP